ncbi:MAG TPA: tetratricopeptide repeat protein [Polyangiaceae bacterium]|nr:tetratricopeptide repeat protein [Polyangiaceae bacterium]
MRLTALLLLVSGCAGVAPLPPQALELNRSGAQALAEGDLEAADARLGLALEYSPRFVEALINLGLVECQRGNFTRARQLLQRARRLNPDVAQVHHALGLLSEREQRPDVASDHYRESLRVDPGFSPARANLGRLLFDARAFEQARVTFQKLIEAAPAEVEGYVGLAESLLQLKRAAEADAVVGRAERLFAGHAAVTVLAARKALRRGQHAAAIAALLPLTARRDDWAAVAFAWLATAELSRSRPHEAIGAAEQALALEPEHPVATLALARALDAVGDPRAVQWVERARLLAKR